MFTSIVVAITCVMSYFIPPDKIDQNKILFGNPEKFNCPAEIDFGAAVKETPEYQIIKDKKLQIGCGEYWIRLSQASEHVCRTVIKVANDTKKDIVVFKDYFEEIGQPEIKPEDVTHIVVCSIKDANKKKSS